MRHLSVPDEIEQSAAVEILRAWVLPNDEIGFVSTAFPVKDFAGLGVFLADLARHYLKIADLSNKDWPIALRRIAAGIVAEAEAEGGSALRHGEN